MDFGQFFDALTAFFFFLGLGLAIYTRDFSYGCACVAGFLGYLRLAVNG